jgi:simple sugar transport system permease protein
MTAGAAAVRESLLDRLPRGNRAVAWIGVLLGLFAFFVALPPIAARSPLWPVLFGLLGMFAGLWGVTRGVGRLAWGALVLGVVGIGLGYLATVSGDAKLDRVVVWSALLAAMLRYATPLTFAALGGMFSERSGVVNIGLEGMMLIGAFFAILAADKLDSWPLGIAAALAAGGLAALIHAFVSISLRADQIVSGTAINFLALGVTGYFFIDVYGDQGTPGEGIPRIPTVNLDFLSSIPGIGTFLEDVFGHLNLMVWLSFVLLIVCYFVMFKSPVGLRLRAVGEHPRATRYVAVVISGMLAALGGAYLSIGFLGSFNENMTAGRGFIALAALIFGNWRPLGLFGAALLFGFSSALAQRLPEYSTSGAVLFQALPYVLTLIAVAGVIGRSIPPAAVGRPYVKQ